MITSPFAFFDELRNGQKKGNAMSNRNTMMVISLIVLLGSVSFLNACNTTAGAGKDISKAGQAIEKSARQNTHY